VDSNSLLTVGHARSLACNSGCRALSRIAAFPADSIPLFTWTATNGVWDDSGGSDLRAVFANSIADGVPYTGATSDVNLGTHKLMAAQLQSGDGVNPGLDLGYDPTGTYCQGWGARVDQALSLTYLYPAGTPPSAGQVMRFGVPDGGISQTTWGNAEDPANKGQANGYASLDATGKVPASQLPASAGYTPLIDNQSNIGPIPVATPASPTALVSTTVPSIPAGKCISATATIKSSDGFAGDLFITFGG